MKPGDLVLVTRGGAATHGPGRARKVRGVVVKIYSDHSIAVRLLEDDPDSTIPEWSEVGHVGHWSRAAIELAERPTLTDAERAVLNATPAHDATPIGPNAVGVAVWGAGAPKLAACSAPYARGAGKVLARLRDKSLVERVGAMGFWRRTRDGDREVAR